MNLFETLFENSEYEKMDPEEQDKFKYEMYLALERAQGLIDRVHHLGDFLNGKDDDYFKMLDPDLFHQIINITIQARGTDDLVRHLTYDHMKYVDPVDEELESPSVSDGNTELRPGVPHPLYGKNILNIPLN